MKKTILTLSAVAAAFAQDLPFERGEINPYSKYFTGTTYLNTFDDAQGGRSANASLVTFEPCSRTHWHTHEKGQLLIILSGEGVVKIEGQKAIKAQPGAIIKIDSDAKHFHAGGKTTQMAHISVMGMPNKTTWLEKVSDEEYESALRELQ
ncbi:cupin domain-containing protein [Campylobacter hyointestinalis]|uniref:cupin domain-containing protein n=1 Tax=Campylobacter hyointestinalis TaxID=198 RepID=UPI000DCBF3DA|nr:cupin domain-containing protein [Campylobacter hyointestinalis]RAZ49241.1 cupin domain-containing protein [Campylobacter hyointestinalis subsp. lawsonii]